MCISTCNRYTGLTRRSGAAGATQQEYDIHCMIFRKHGTSGALVGMIPYDRHCMTGFNRCQLLHGARVRRTRNCNFQAGTTGAHLTILYPSQSLINLIKFVPGRYQLDTYHDSFCYICALPLSCPSVSRCARKSAQPLHQRVIKDKASTDTTPTLKVAAPASAPFRFIAVHHTS